MPDGVDRLLRREHRRAAQLEGRRRWARSPTPAARRGAPCSASDGAVYVTQGGNVPGSPRPERGRRHPARERRRLGRAALDSSIGGHTLAGPNDLAFGPDGRLWFTDSGTEQDDRFAPDERGARPAVRARLRRRRRVPDGAAGRLPERHRVRRRRSGCTGPSRPRTACAGSTTARRRRSASSPTATCPTAWRSRPTAGVRVHDDLGRRHGALGRRRGARGDLASASTPPTASSPARRSTSPRPKVAEIHADQRTGTFWRVETDAIGGLPLIPGRL